MVEGASNPVAAAKAYASMAKVGGAGVSPAAESGDSAGVPFGEMLEQATRSAIGTLKEGEKASAGGITGQIDPLAVTQAVTAARLVLDTFAAVRDQAIDAYNKIIQMPI